MKRYETIFIAHPELSEADQTELEGKLRSIMASLKGDILNLEDWGTKKLAYKIRKNTRGRYFLLDYLAAPDLVRELERTLRLNDRVLKFQTVKVSDQVSPEAAKTLKEAAPTERVIKVSERSLSPEEPVRKENAASAGEEEK
ncbi:MAG: 30S ribosomal protein S6 [Deltaproteobacteria bacterium]|nr:30S ribosomal protein S6 [Deltaproteobacteria bacterium]